MHYYICCYYGAITDAQGLLLTLSSGITLGSSVYRWYVELNQVSDMQDPIQYTLSPMTLTLYLSQMYM